MGGTYLRSLLLAISIYAYIYLKESLRIAAVEVFFLCLFSLAMARVCYAPEGGLLLKVLVDKPTGKEQVALMIKL